MTVYPCTLTHCVSVWDAANAATVACRQLGYSGGVHCNADTAGVPVDGEPPQAASEMWPDGHYGFVLDDVHCSGTENTLQQCTDFVGPEQENCSPSEGIFLVCGTDRCPPPPPIWGLRISNPSEYGNPYEGILDGNLNGQGILEASTDGGVTWGPVCDDYFDQDGNAAEVVCRQLGWNPDAGSFGHCDTNVLEPNFVLDDVICASPNAQTLADCQYQTTHNCDSTEGVWINCASTSCAAATAAQDALLAAVTPVPPVAAMRLVEQGTGRQASGTLGVLQAQVGGRWGYVCDDGFDDASAEVACRTIFGTSTRADSTHCDAHVPCDGALHIDGVANTNPCGYTLDDAICTDGAASSFNGAAADVLLAFSMLRIVT
jgi:hypothetical protein